MGTFTRLLLLPLAAIALTGCPSAPSTPFVGKWKQVGGSGGEFEFFPNGTLKWSSLGTDKAGEWSSVDADTFQATVYFNAPFMNTSKYICDWSLSGSRLSISGWDGETITLEKG